MDIYWLGQAAFKIKGKSATLIIDPFNPSFTGLKIPKDLSADLVLVSHQHDDHNFTAAVLGQPLVIAGPGEYEARGVGVLGVGTYHDNSSGSQRGKNTVYKILLDGVSLVHLGDLGHALSNDQVDQIGRCDVLMVPVGSVYTIGSQVGATVVAQLEPKIVIPMHYKLPDLKFELLGVEGFLKEMGAEGVVPIPKLSITKEKLPEETQVVLLSKT